MNEADWLAEAFDDLTDEMSFVSPSEWAEAHRRLPSSVTSKPGPYDYDVMPYLREIVDCLDVRCPVREVAIMKGAQTGGTVGVLENFLGYVMSHVRTAPMVFFTATQVLASIRMDKYVMPMIEHSELEGCLQSTSLNNRKQAATSNQLSFFGGGFCIFSGAESEANFRSISARFGVFDEVDTWVKSVGVDGDPLDLGKSRTKGFEDTRKILTISTPTTTEESRILKEFNAGDQRRYHVPCLGCGKFQEIRWRYDDKHGVQKGGIVWAMDDGRVIPGSVAYACRYCGHCHSNSHKRLLLPRGKWVATAKPNHPTVRSYHISGLLSPPGFYSWESAVIDWLKAWNVETNQPRSVEKLKVFYNNVLGNPYNTGGTKLTMARVARHVREYHMNQIPNVFAAAMCGGKVQYLTCAADIQKTFIAAAVYAWGPGRSGYLVARYRFEGETLDPFAATGPWKELEELIDRKFHDGVDREYPVKITLVDSNYMTAEVYSFCAQFSSGVYPLRGDVRASSGPSKEFKRIKDASSTGVDGWNIGVNHYKSRLSSVLRAAPQPSTELAPTDSVSFPVDLPDDALEELTAEQFCEVIDKNGRKSWTWKRTGRNELWDLTVYNMAARDIVAFMLCREYLELDTIVWGAFWQLMEDRRIGWAEVAPVADPAQNGVQSS